ncbi:MAG TPA: hypothetical protein EYO73_08190 [Sulfurimonas sp.]|nr:hypothetical protein [Sulfurimonas sp.]
MNTTHSCGTNFKTLLEKAQTNVKELIKTVFTHTNKEHAIVVYDTSCTLSMILSKAYIEAIPHAKAVDFNETKAEDILSLFDGLKEDDLVVLVQSTSFRLDAFRMRVELFKKKIKVLEHPHLSRMAEDEIEHYINALEYEESYFRGLGRRLKDKVDSASTCVLDTGGDLLSYTAGFEPAKLNIGDYTDMVNTGGQFPIGEVFTESKDLCSLNGRMKLFCFGDVSYKINVPEVPITLIIEKGRVVDALNSTPAFDLIMSNIRRDEGNEIWVRELGFGLNRAFAKDRRVADTGSFERMCGVHISLGRKHGIYGKPDFKRRDGRYHVDVFSDTKTLSLDGEIVYEKGKWQV